MNSDELRATLIEWLEDVKTWWNSSDQQWTDYILTDQQWMEYLYPYGIPEELEWKPDDSRLHVQLFTNDNEYQISASATYLGCISTTRKFRAGENWKRGSDLPDGPFSKKTFDSIIKRITGYELIAKVRVMPVKQVETINQEK